MKVNISSNAVLAFFLVLLGTSVFHVGVYAQKKTIKKVVLDAGHGGRDPGAVRYKMTKDEKDIALDVVLKLGKMINDSLKDVEVVYTRKTDFYPELKERHAVANNANADLFISVHVNATAGTRSKVPNGFKYVGKGSKRRKVQVYKTVVNRETKATGTETYVLGLHRNAQKEKAIGEFGDNVTEEPGMLDENDPMTQIIVAQYSKAFLNKSINFGDKVERSFVQYTGRKSAGVKQKGLEVLAGSAMPGVLIELGFINNEEDEIYMNSEEGQLQLVYAIFRAIKEYKIEMSK
jgi:N-acetylmuramoyl-L-alanine amidase